VTTLPAPPAYPLTFTGSDPVVGPQQGFSFVNPGWVVRDGDRWHMFANSFSGWPGFSTVDHFSSADGETWTKPEVLPVFTSDDVPFADDNAFFMSGSVEDDGTWVAYYYTYEGSRNPGYIGRATAPGPEGPWTSDPVPILAPGTTDAWDGVRLAEPSVISTTDGFMMYYTGYDESGTARIGLATSAEGVAWTKHADPVLEALQGWEGGGVRGPQVVLRAGYLVMAYRAGPLGVYRAGLATSRDGTGWAPLPSNPVLTDDQTPGGDKLYQFELVADDDLRLYVEVGPAPARTDVYLAHLPAPDGRPGIGARLVQDGSGVLIDVQPVGFQVGFSRGDPDRLHVHAAIDRGPPAPGEDVPLNDPTIVHSATERLQISDLGPGEHTIWVFAADGNDRAVETPTPLRISLELP
jgi:hypothetical protein